MTLTATFLLWLLLVAAYDFQRRRVPNWLVVAGTALAATALVSGTGPLGLDWKAALLGGVVGFGFLLLFYATGLMGAGDVKFGGVLGLWVGLPAFIPIWVIASLLAFAHAVLWRYLERWPFSPRLTSMLAGPSRTSESSTPPRRIRIIPYAAYLALAAMVWVVWGRQS